MWVKRRRVLASAAAVLGLLAPVAPAATAAPDGDEPSSAKQELLQQPSARDGSQSQQSPPSSPLADRQRRELAAERDSDLVVIAVKVRPGASDAVAVAAVTGAALAQGGEERHTLPQLDTVTVEVPKATAKAFTASMRGRADVTEVDQVARRWPTFVPNDPRYASAQSSYLRAVTAPAAWSLHKGDPGVRIAVVDTGVDINHPDLRGRIAGRYNAVTGGTNVTDTLGHGTFVAGVAVATGNNGIGIAGASMGASVLAVKVANSGGLIYSDAVAGGITWAADHGAKVINISLGSDTSDSIERDAIAYAIGKGVLVVASAGNDGTTTRLYPAAYPGVVAVGATDVDTGRRAWFSQHGSWVTVGAPGVNITGTTPTAGSSLFSSRSGYSSGAGTSFSAPIVAAEAALLWSSLPNATAANVRLAIVRSAHGYSNLGLGTGQVDFQAALNRLRPATIPTLTRPAGGATVAGVVRLTAASTAPKVRFLVSGSPLGAPVATKAGVASIAWPSWGVANGMRAVKAVDCSIGGYCNTSGPQVGVTLANAVPAITSPRVSQTLSGRATFTATASGGGVAFLIDGVRRGFDATAPYSLPYPISSLVNKGHTIQARGCSVAGNRCAGPASPPVSFSANSLHPRITALAPSVFSPNGDGRYDTTKLTYSLPDAQSVRFQVRNAAGTVIRGPSRLGTLRAGRRDLSWNGRLASGARARNGTYTLEIATSRTNGSGTMHGWAVTRVRINTAAATFRP